MSSAGWYPDPGKQPGMYRWWDGQAWSAALSPNPNAAPPHGGLGAPTTGPGTAPITTSANPARDPIATQPQPGPGVPPPGMPPQRNRRAAAMWIGAIAGLVAVIVVAAFVIRGMTGGEEIANNPSGNATRNVCPPQATIAPSADRPTRNGRVYGGELSYPTLSPPWGTPSVETRVPFGRNAWTQNILVERYGPTQSWVASVLIAELNAGDGFYTPQRGSEIVVQCIVGAFYGDAKVDRQDRVNRATTVQGKEAWLVESHLKFNIPNLRTKGELAIVMIVQTSESRSSIFYASIPDTSPQWEAPAREAMAALAVGG